MLDDAVHVVVVDLGGGECIVASEHDVRVIVRLRLKEAVQVPLEMRHHLVRVEVLRIFVEHYHLVVVDIERKTFWEAIITVLLDD